MSADTTVAETTEPTAVPTTTTTVASATTATNVVRSTIPPATVSVPSFEIPTTAVPTTVTTLPTTAAPAETAAPTTAPPATPAPATTAPPPPTTPAGPTCVTCRSDYVFPYASHFVVPQLGTEPVRGTGCGGDGSLGEVIPDGIWNGFVKIGKDTLSIDVQCIYYGASAEPFIAECERQNPDEGCDEFGDFWMVNNNPRTRSVPLDASFRRRYEDLNCADPGPGKGATSPSPEADQFDSWLIIENGRATFALTSCIYG